MQRRIFLIAGGAALLPQPAAAATLADEIFTLTNTARNQQNLRPFARSGTLERLAKSYAKVLLRAGRLSHSADGTSLTGRLASVGYRYRQAAENIAFQSGESSSNLAATLLKSWLTSEGHRRNILHTTLTEIGVGTATSGRTTYAVQVFGTPR